MASAAPSEVLLIRHAPACHEGRLAGRRDVAADLSDTQGLAALRRAVGAVDRVIASPALRCRQTASALWTDDATCDERLWEQDFGAWEGLPFADLPDTGTLPLAQLAAHAPEGGESFVALCARVAPALVEIGEMPGRSVIVAHAGTVRAALAMALGVTAPALGFIIDPLSITRLIPCEGVWAIGNVNSVARA